MLPVAFPVFHSLFLSLSEENRKNEKWSDENIFCLFINSFISSSIKHIIKLFSISLNWSIMKSSVSSSSILISTFPKTNHHLWSVYINANGPLISTLVYSSSSSRWSWNYANVVFSSLLPHFPTSSSISIRKSICHCPEILLENFHLHKNTTREKERQRESAQCPEIFFESLAFTIHFCSLIFVN